VLAIYIQPPIDTKICAIVDPMHNTAVWMKRGNTGSAFYSDTGEITYDNPVPRIVEQLVENKTGKKIRIGCKLDRDAPILYK